VTAILQLIWALLSEPLPEISRLAFVPDHGGSVNN
jgi:hypothetical protein